MQFRTQSHVQAPNGAQANTETPTRPQADSASASRPASPPAPEPHRDVIALDDVTLRYPAGDGEVVALAGFDLRVAEGERVAIVGPSGCGKSTLLSLTAGLLAPQAGVVTVRGQVALMPQRDLLVPWRSALRNAALALEAQGVPAREATERARPLFERFGLSGFEGSRTWQLSGGMRQRVAFLRTMLTGRPVLALDEPFGALDAITRGEMHEWLEVALAGEPRTLLLVTHDIEEALTLADRVVLMTPRPGRAAGELAVDRPAGSTRAEWTTSAEFSMLKAAALETLR
ncbi:MAG: ABC transporter ATP-binding protein [Actinobacteria bacterium]|nr:ABC transporter ATP-binding protein [Actinomycetota bacterium]